MINHNPKYFSTKFLSPTPAVFVDRDGVINEEVELLHREDDFKLISGSLQAIKKLNDSSLPVVVFSNQTVVARGMVSEEFVQKINQKIVDELEKIGGHLDAVLYCPHSPKADLEEYRLDCPWRKPKPGMLYEAADKLNLDLKNSWVIGDTARDVLAGQTAGAKTIIVQTGHKGEDQLFDAKPDYICDDLKAALELIVKHK